MDPGDRVELAAKSLDQAFFAGRTVYIDEFDTFNHSKRAMLAAMLPVADVTVSLCCDQAPDQADDGVFSGARRVANTLKSMAASAGVPCKEIRLTQDMRHKDAPVLAELGLLLADPTYTPEAEVDPAAPAITYYKADSRQAEAKAVAAAVKARARAGVPYNKMAVICRTADQYLPQIRYEFRLQNIPLFCDEPTTPENTAPARAIHAALDLLRGDLTTTALLRLLKTGLVDLDRDSQCALENYAYTWPLHAQDWREPFTRNPEGYTDRMSEQSQQDLQRAEEARRHVARYIGEGRARRCEEAAHHTDEEAGTVGNRLADKGREHGNHKLNRIVADGLEERGGSGIWLDRQAAGRNQLRGGRAGCYQRPVRGDGHQHGRCERRGNPVQESTGWVYLCRDAPACAAGRARRDRRDQ